MIVYSPWCTIVRLVMVSCLGITRVLWIKFILENFLSFSAAYSVDHVSRLHKDLFANYSKHVRPKRNQSEPTTMNINMSFILIHQLNMKTQILKSGGWLNTRWTDEFLVWNPEDYGGITLLTVPETSIWKPDILPYNIVEGKRVFGSTELLVKITPQGRISWDPDFILETRCPVDITYFPFGTQMCDIEILSWELDRKQLKLTTTQKVPSLEWSVKNGEFDLKGSHIIHDKKWSVDILKFGLTLTRRTLFYVFALVLPVVLLSFLCVVSFLVPMESGERMTISMTTLLSFTVYMGVVDKMMPKTSETISLLVVYVTTLLTISLLTVVGNATVLFIYYRWNKEKPIQHSNCHSISSKRTDDDTNQINHSQIFSTIWTYRPVTQEPGSPLNVPCDANLILGVLEKLIVDAEHESGNDLFDATAESNPGTIASNQIITSSYTSARNRNDNVVNYTNGRSANEMAILVNVVLMFVTTFCLLCALIVMFVIVWEQSNRRERIHNN